MTRPIRFLPEDHVVEVTCRTIQARHLLSPSAELEDIAIGVMGRAQEMSGMTIYAYSLPANHFHLLLGPRSPQQLAAFMCYLSSNLAREVGRLHDWLARVWSRRYRAIVVERSEIAEVSRLKYILAQGCKDGLFATPLEFPGATSVHPLLTGEPAVGTWFNRTLEYRARRKGLKVERGAFATRHAVVLSPLPCWGHVAPEDYRHRIRDLVDAIAREAAIEAVASGRRPRGAAFVRRLHPHSRPRSPKRSPAPSFHAASKAARHSLRDAYRAFLDAYRRAALHLAGGDLTARFPERSFPPPMPYVCGPGARAPA